MPSVIRVKNRLTIQIRKYSPAEPVNSGRMTRSPAPAGAGPDLAGGAAPPLLNDFPPVGSVTVRKMNSFYRWRLASWTSLWTSGSRNSKQKGTAVAVPLSKCPDNLDRISPALILHAASDRRFGERPSRCGSLAPVACPLSFAETRLSRLACLALITFLCLLRLPFTLIHPPLCDA